MSLCSFIHVSVLYATFHLPNALASILARCFDNAFSPISLCVCHTKRVERSTDRNLPPIFTKLATKVFPEDVVIYCFWWKSEIFLSAKPEVELIRTIAPMEKYF